MALTKIGSIGINTGIAFAGVTTIATLNGSDNILSVGGTVNFNSDVSIGGSVSIGGTLTYEDVTNIDSVGLITARNGIVVGSGITLSVDGHGFFTGVVTATTFKGDGSQLSNVTSTTINNNANNRLITGSDTANTLEGESTLTYDGTNLDLGDDKKIRLGAGQDLSIYHQSSNNHSYISETGSGSLIVLADDLYIQDTSTNTMISAIEGDAVTLHFNSNAKLATTNTGINVTGATVDDGATHDGDVTFTGASYNMTWDKSDDSLRVNDNARIKFGTGKDLHIYHNESNSVIREEGTGNLNIQTTGGNVEILTNTSETSAKFISNGAVELYHDNTKMAYTSASGFEVTNGDFRCHLDIKVLNDDRKLFLGAGGDLKLYHDGSNSYIDNITGDFYIRGVDEKYLYIQAKSGENSIVCKDDGAVELYHDNSKKLETASGGITVTGTVAATSYTGDGSNLSGISVGTTTESLTKTDGQTATLDLSKDDHKVTATGTVTIDTTGGTEAESHTLRIVNNGSATIVFSSKFLFPSGGTPNMPTTSGGISLISFTVHQTSGSVKLLAGASVNFS